MNGYILMADSYRKAAGEGQIEAGEAERIARLYDFLGTCSQEDIYKLFDSTAFNEIAKDYMRKAVSRLVDNGTLDEEQGQAVRNEYAYMFSIMTAKEISEA